MPNPASSKPQTTLIAGALFALLYTVYLLTFSGQFTSIDELALYARSESLVQRGELSAPQISFAAYHNAVGPIEPGYAIAAAPLYWLAQRSQHINNIHAVMLLNPLLVAATAVLLYLTARLLRYSQQAAVTAALAFGLTSLAWPYARSFYREPLVGLLWMMGLYGLVRWRYQKQRVWAGVGGIALGLSLLVKSSAIAGVPVIFIAALAGITDKRQLMRYGAILTAALAILALLFQIAFALRFGGGSSFADWTNWSLATSLPRIYGQLLSPGKGLLFYTPTTLLALIGFIWMTKRHTAVTAASCLPLAFLVLAYSGYSAWYGGQSWGPRFLLPALPLFFLGVAPLWDGVRWPVGRGFSLGLLGVGLLVQLAAVTAAWSMGAEPLYQSHPQPENTTGLLLTNWHLSPPLVQILSWRVSALDLLWWHPDLEGNMLLAKRLVAGLAVAVLAAGGLLGLAVRGKLWPWLWPWPPLLATAVLLGWGASAVSGYPGFTAADGRAVARWVQTEANTPYTLVTVSNEFHIYFYLGFLKGNFTHHWYSPMPTAGFEPILAQTTGERLALVVDRVHIQPDRSGKDLEWWLNEQFYRANSDWIDSYELVNYVYPTGPMAWQAAEYQFGESYTLQQFSLSHTTIRPGDVLRVQLDLCQSGPPPSYHHLFVHLISSNGAINGFDGPIRYGGTWLLPWEVGDCLVERRALPIPPTAVPGTYNLIIGFDTDAGPLLVANGAGEMATYIVLGRVEVGE